MASPFPGMDPFLEKNPIFHELHTQMLAEAQAQLQPQVRPKYVVRLERHLSEGSVWNFDGVSLAGKEPDVLSPSNKQPGSIGQARYLEKRASALHGGLHWVEIDLLRGGKRPPMPCVMDEEPHYLAYIARATTAGWSHQAFAWSVCDALPHLPIPLIGDDRAVLDVGACFAQAYDRVAADDEADYKSPPPSPRLSAADSKWAGDLPAAAGLTRS